MSSGCARRLAASISPGLAPLCPRPRPGAPAGSGLASTRPRATCARRLHESALAASLRVLLPGAPALRRLLRTPAPHWPSASRRAKSCPLRSSVATSFLQPESLLRSRPTARTRWPAPSTPTARRLRSRLRKKSASPSRPPGRVTAPPWSAAPRQLAPSATPPAMASYPAPPPRAGFHDATCFSASAPRRLPRCCLLWPPAQRLRPVLARATPPAVAARPSASAPCRLPQCRLLWLAAPAPPPRAGSRCGRLLTQKRNRRRRDAG